MKRNKCLTVVREQRDRPHMWHRINDFVRRVLPTGQDPQPRQIRCYRCHHDFEVGPRAQSTSCPGCYKPIIVEDIILRKNRPKSLMVTKLQTCGRIVVPKRSRLVANLIEASEGCEVYGELQAKQVVSGKQVLIGAMAVWKGDLQAPSLLIEDGAVIGGQFRVPNQGSPIVIVPITNTFTGGSIHKTPYLR